jgi:hypothetical protein
MSVKPELGRNKFLTLCEDDILHQLDISPKEQYETWHELSNQVVRLSAEKRVLTEDVERLRLKKVLYRKIKLIRVEGRKRDVYEEMPIPQQGVKLSDAKMMYKGMSGIYIAHTNDGRCSYVGKSKDVGARLKSHNVISESNTYSICIVPLSETEIHRHELFYIWLYNPLLNDQTKRAM